MESPFLAWLVWLACWLLGLLSDCIQAWCKQVILRRLGIDNPSPQAPAAQADAAPVAVSDGLLSEPEPLIDRLYQTVARYRPGDRA